MPSGRKPNLERRRLVRELREHGRTLTEIAQQFGVSKQAIWSLLHSRPQRTAARAVACSVCGTMIVSPGALRRDAATALCLPCLRARPETPFAQRLKALRLAAGLSRAELADRSGVSPGALRAYEDGRRKPQESTTARLAFLGDLALRGPTRQSATKQFCDAS
jgi:transcriptional regulator with XRE-family HTH domain